MVGARGGRRGRPVFGGGAPGRVARGAGAPHLCSRRWCHGVGFGRIRVVPCGICFRLRIANDRVAKVRSNTRHDERHVLSRYAGLAATASLLS